MTYSETKFREYLWKLINDPEMYIRKIPDFKQTGLTTGIGLPDYMVITNGHTYWFEVKQVISKKYTPHTFNLNNISDAQYTEFIAMHNAGAKIFIAIYLNKDLYIIPYKDIQIAKFLGGATSIHTDVLNKWRLKKW